jgi:hypothetical protein
MPIQPLSQPVREISLTAAIEPANERVKRVLLQPLNHGKWCRCVTWRNTVRSMMYFRPRRHRCRLELIF